MKRVAVSNIAWPADADAEALALAASLGFEGIELAPTKALGPWPTITGDGARAYRDRLAGQGLAIPAFQAILFGVEGCALFGGPDARQRLAAHLTTVAAIAGAASAGVCVFGAPKLRDPGDLAPCEAFDQAVAFFRALAPSFAENGTALAIEPNPPGYGCRFVTTTREAIALVAAVDHAGFRVQIDAGCVFANGESAADLAAAVPHAAHFHASEFGLPPIGAAAADHAMVASALAGAGYWGWRSVEMLAKDDWRANLRRAAALMRRVYA